jgi:hypothetical protein
MSTHYEDHARVQVEKDPLAEIRVALLNVDRVCQIHGLEAVGTLAVTHHGRSQLLGARDRSGLVTYVHDQSGVRARLMGRDLAHMEELP